jgi:hypothetical protein
VKKSRILSVLWMSILISWRACPGCKNLNNEIMKIKIKAKNNENKNKEK